MNTLRNMEAVTGNIDSYAKAVEPVSLKSMWAQSAHVCLHFPLSSSVSDHALLAPFWILCYHLALSGDRREIPARAAIRRI